MRRRGTTLLRERLKLSGLISLTLLLLLYPADWVAWRLLTLLGHGMGSAAVSQTTAATLKGNHFEIYQQQSLIVTCSHSLLPEAGAGPCWWLRLHPQQVVQY